MNSMKVYIKLDKHGVVRDVLTYPYEGFEEVEYDDHVLPRNISAGYYKWTGTDFIVDEQLKEEVVRENGGYLEEENAALKIAMAELAESLELERQSTRIALAELAEAMAGGVE